MTAECWICMEPPDSCTCDRFETWGDDEGPICPHCGEVNRACDSEGTLWDESTTETSCDHCGKDFDVSVSVSFSWAAYGPKRDEP